MLQLPDECRVFEAKHACFGGTAGLFGGLDWIASGSARGRHALIICADLARYALGSPGEPTQGAGAVALLLSENPRLIQLDPSVSGTFARDVDDFWRPLYARDALVDGQRSVQCYLDALAGAHAAWRRTFGPGPDVARRCYHVPYPKMAKKAHRHLMQLMGRGDAEADDSYQREVAASVRMPAEVGNIYTGSLYLALASLLDADAAAIEGEWVTFFSYGSGCAAEFFAGRVSAGAAAWVERLALRAPLEARHEYSIAEYETLRNSDGEPWRPLGEAGAWPSGKVSFRGIEGDRRLYGG